MQGESEEGKDVISKLKPIATTEGITYEQLIKLTGGIREVPEASQASQDDDNKPSRFIQGINKKRTNTMISKPATDSKFDKKGNYRALLTEIQCYTEENFNTKEKEPNLTFIFNLGDLDNTGKDVEFYQGFVRIPTDNEGMPLMGGRDSRYYKIVSSFFGEMFDPKSDTYKVELGFPEEYDTPEGILAMPSYKDYQKDEPRLKLNHLKVNGKNIIGLEGDIKLDYPQKPDGTLGKNIAIVEASPKPKEVARRAGTAASTVAMSL